MGMAFNRADFMRRVKRSLHLYLPFILIVSTLSLASVPTASATSRTAGSGACAQAYTFNSGAEAFSVIEDGGFCYISFRNTAAAGSPSSSYTWRKPAGVTSLNVLVVGGGGGGGSRHGGGGGAGSYVEAIGLAAPSIETSINVIVGAGGIGAAGGTSPFVGAGSKGSQSSFRIGTTNGLVALGGGAGINGSDVNIVDGGSGGGAGASQVAGEAIRSTQRALASDTQITDIEFVNVGAAGASEPNSGTSLGRDYWAAGGGGGAGGRGERPSVNNTEISVNTTVFSDGTGAGTRGGNGGIGKIPSSNFLSSSIASQLSVGQVVSGQVYFAGGGGGGMGADGDAGGSGGLGGGGNGTKAVSTGGVAGLASTGGGGGGSGFDDISPVTGDVANPPGGAGGSGVVVVRYAATYTVTYNYNSATGGNSTLSSNFTTGGTAITLPTPTRTGYTFDGWFVASDFSGSAIGSTYSPTSSLTIHAKWNAKSCTLNETASGGFTTITFTSVQDCVWTAPAGITSAQVLVVGAGGGGGADGGGGGGGGGVAQNNSFSITGNASYTVMVGQGGSGGNGYKSGSTCTGSFSGWSTTAVGCDGATGGSSSFGSISASGGGGGGGIESSGLADSNALATARGGGGGAGAQNDKTGTGSAGVGGFTGGTVLNGAGNAAAGGASAAANGSNGSSTLAGAGATGVTATLNSIVYGSGGAGGSYNNATVALGGTGAGNGGSLNVGPTTPVANRGGGGGGGGNGQNGSNALGTAGAAGVVIVRYVSTYTVTYSYDNADAGNTTSSSTFAPGGTAITLPTPTKTGFSFTGWFTASSGGSLVGAGGSSYTPSGTNPAITIHARWAAPSGTVNVPSAPNSITATASNGGIALTWAQPVSLAGKTISNYQVEYSTTGAAGAWTVASSTIASNATSYTITGLTSNTAYYVRIAALFSGGRGAYGYPWQKIYGTSTPTRSSGAVVYQNGFGTSEGDAFSRFSAFTRVRYLMKATYGGNQNYADVDFAKGLRNASGSTTSGFALDSVSNIRIPSTVSGQQFVTQGDVYDLTVLAPSTVTVQNGYGFNGRVEIWPWNYAVEAPSGVSARATDLYDDADSSWGNGEYGSFQLHNITNGSSDYRQTVLAWNRQFANTTPEIGFGNHGGTHSDWTFCFDSSSCTSRTNFSLEIFVNAPITINTLNITYDANGGTTPSGGSATTVVGGTVSTLPTTSFTGYTFNGWFTSSSGGTQITTSAAHNQSSNFTLYAQWTQNFSINVTQTSNGSISYNGSTASETVTVTSGSNATFTFIPNAGYEVESILIDGTSLSTAASPSLTNLQTAITSGYTFTNITSNKTISATYSPISSTDLLLNLDGTRSSSLPAAAGTLTPTWTSITPGATVSATGSTGTQVATGTTTSPNAPKSVYLNNNGSNITPGLGSSFNFGKTTGVSLGTTGQTSPVTVEMWINPKTLRGTTDTPWNILFTKWFTSTNRTSTSSDLEFHYALKWNGSSVRQNLYTTSCSDKYGTRTFGTGADLALDAWHLVGFTVDASGNLQFYANGKPDGSSQSGCGITIRNTTFAIIGDLIQAAGFTGSIAKVRFYKTALSAATMQSNYNADARLFAKAPIYTVTYNYDSATSGNSTLSSDYTFGGTAITLPTPSRTGYAFDGWFTQASGGSKIGDGGASYTPSASATIFARWTYNAALNPVFGTPTSTADGFTVSITNYDATYTWATPTVTSGSVAVTSTTGSTRVLTVTGLSPGTTATITQGTTKTGHGNGSATVSGSSTTGAALTPTFSTPTRTSGGFTVTITNYDAAYTWDTATVTAGVVTVTSTSGSNRVLTVSGLNPGASATITQTTSRSGYSNGSATVTGTASVVVSALSIGGVTAPVRGATPVTTVTTATGYTGTVTWAAGGTPLVGNFAAGTVYTATITLTATAGFTFTGVSANSFTVSGATATNLINSGVVMAVFPATIASITYSAGTGGSGTAPSSPTTVAIGGTFTTPFSLYTRAGYSFSGWNDGIRTYAANALYPETGTVTSNVTLTAQWSGVTYTVLFEYNGRTGGDSDTSRQFTTGGTAMTLPTPTRTGYTFANWFSNIALTTLVGSAGASYEPTANLTLYAKWNPINYTVTYNSTNVVGGSTINSSSGTVPTDATNYNIGQRVSIKSNSGLLARTGYTFAGWVTSADGTGTAFNSGETIEVGSQSINLYPKWTANTYTFTFNLNGGSSDTSTVQATWTVGNPDVTLPTTGITRTGYTFGNGSGGYWSSTQGGAAVANTFSNIGNVTLYAIWTVKTIAYSFSKGTADGLTIANFPTNSSNTFGSTITLPNLTGTTVTISSNTHLFSGWSFNNTVYQSGGSFVLSEVQPTFTAIWTRLYDVKYGFAGGTKASADAETNDGDAECVTSGLCTPNQVITLRGAPTRTGYTFAGWKVQDTSTVLAALSTATITDTSYLFFAQWTPVDYVFSFNSSGGSNSYVNETKNIGQLLTLPNPGSRTGYSFAGWSPDNGTTKLAIGSTWVVGSSSQAFVAYWTPNIYTIIFDWQGATGSVSPNVSYTVGTGNLSLPTVENRVKDGYIFGGWAETSSGTTPLTNYQPTSDRVLYAIWNDGNFSLTLNGNGATLATEVVAVPRASASYTLPTRTRSNFKFIGWFDAASGGNFIGNAGATYVVPASRTIFARWVQDSFFGVDEATLETASTFTASDSTGVDSTITHNPSGSSARVQIQAGALPAGTVISVRYFRETSRQQSLIGADKNYFFSVLVSWLLGSGSSATVPNTANDKPIVVTLTNTAIRAGAMVYRVLGGVVTELQRATVDGSITVELRSDPELVIAAIKPTAPRSVTASSSGSGSVAVSWLAPTSNGGSEVIEYTASVSTDSSKSCTTATLSCTISGLTNSTNYSFVVTATNGVGVSPASSPFSASTGTLYTVTFDSKGGTAVANGSFYTASTVSEPTAPTKDGYTFAGWSATDGGSAVTFAYNPGVTNNITLYALWNAVNHVVTFDSKSGSSVTPSSFPTGGTVAEPTAPTRSGFTFAGWSATDGGSAITFPYTPGVLTGITLYAKWTAVVQSGGSGGGGSTAPSTPAPSEPVTPSTPVKSNVTTAPPVVVVGNQDAKVITVEIKPASTEAGAKPPTIKIDTASEKFIADVKVVDGKLTLTPEVGFSGRKTVTVAITENGADRIVQIPLTVLPEAVTKPVLTPTASNRSVIRWSPSPNATTYTVLLNGKRVCTTTATSCAARQILGPDAVIEIVSNGGDRTVSEKIEADFRQVNPVRITRIVSATITKATLTKVDTRALDKVIALIGTQGFGTVVISEITTTKKTAALAAARIAAIKKYIDDKTGTREVAFEVVPATTRTYFNNISVKG